MLDFDFKAMHTKDEKDIVLMEKKKRLLKWNVLLY